ncbi:MAG: XRE family transcriptional regulator [Lactococcus hircilactis]
MNKKIDGRIGNLGNKETMARNLRRMLDRKGLNPHQFSEIMNFKYTTVMNWMSAKTYPRIDKIELMSRYFGVDKSELVEEYSSSSLLLSNIVNISKQLEEPRKEKVLTFATAQLDEQKLEENKVISINYNKTSNLTAVETIEQVSAGFGFHYGENEKTIYYTLRTDLPRFDFATVVTGDSMEPTLHDGDVILVRQNYDMPNGGIFVVDYDGTAWVKEVRINDDELILHSVNEKYRDRFLPVPPEDGSYWNIVGEVVDWFTPEII